MPVAVCLLEVPFWLANKSMWFFGCCAVNGYSIEALLISIGGMLGAQIIFREPCN